MNRTTQTPSPTELTHKAEDDFHLLIALVVHTGKWLAQPGPRNQPG
jgi:hypothetical protein